MSHFRIQRVCPGKLTPFIYLFTLLSLFLLSGCTSIFWLTAAPLLRTATTTAIAAKPQPVIEIPLRGPLTSRRAEFSGLAWYGDHLILLPQWPTHWANQLFYLNKADIVAFLTHKKTTPLAPQPIRLVNGDLAGQIPRFDGFEALAFDGDRAFLTIEAKPDQGMMGYLITGVMAPDLSELRLDSTRMPKIQPQTNIDNFADEAIFLAGNRVVTLYETSSIFVNPEPVAHLFDQTLKPQGTIPMADFPYRNTDATPLDKANRFWVINYFFPGDKQLRSELGLPGKAANPLTKDKPVERLVEFEYSPTGITRVDTPPITLRLLDNNVARNWEGIARLETPTLNGFLLVTDYYPETIFAFVPKPK